MLLWQTPLLWAAKNAHEAVVRLLIERNVNINVKDEYGYTPLTWAAMNGHQAVVRLLIEREIGRASCRERVFLSV